MSAKYSKGSHTVHDLKYHFVWCTKYRYDVLRGEVALRLRALLKQTCAEKNVTIINGAIAKDHVHMLLSCPPKIAPADLAQELKGRSAHILLIEFRDLKKRYYGGHLWGRGYFVASVGAVDEETIRHYVETQGEDDSNDNFKIVDKDE